MSVLECLPFTNGNFLIYIYIGIYYYLTVISDNKSNGFGLKFIGIIISCNLCLLILITLRKIFIINLRTCK